MNKQAETKRLIEALDLCKKAAHKSGVRAVKELAVARADIEKIRDSVRNIRSQLDGIALLADESRNSIRRQLQEMADFLANDFHKVEQRVKLRRTKLESFNVVIFGRTMAGKSTLMEILTRGDGTHIGQGAQRTTTEVRSYEWRGLRVVDVPGVAAFDGGEDEKVAYNEAVQADLVIFLLTDDAPQLTEMTHYARVRQLGKPIISLLNIKQGLDTDRKLRRFLKSPNHKFGPNRIKEFEEQLSVMLKEHVPRNQHPRLLPVHLQAKFMAHQPQHKVLQSQLEKASRFDKFETHLVQFIEKDGVTARYKTLLDAACVPLLDLSYIMLEHCAVSRANALDTLSNGQKVKEWTDVYKERLLKDITGFVKQEIALLKEGLSDFCEKHIEDSKDQLVESWNAYIAQARLNQKAEDYCIGVNKEIDQRLAEFLRQYKREYQVISELDTVRGPEAPVIGIDWRRATKWGATAALAVVPLIGAPPILGVIVSVTAVVGSFISDWFEDRENKLKSARIKLYKELDDNLVSLELKMGRKIWEWAEKNALSRLNECSKHFEGMVRLQDSLAKQNRQLARDLFIRVGSLQRVFIEWLLEQEGDDTSVIELRAVARVPGVATALLVSKVDKSVVMICHRLEEVLEEEVMPVEDNMGDVESIFRQLVSRHASSLKFIHWRQEVEVKFDTRVVSPTNKARLRMAQQLTAWVVKVI